MILIKVADISNEARPMEVAEPWLDRLLQEFFKQSDAEKLEGLPVTPFMDRDKVTKPSSQCSFIGLVLLPLFEALGELFPELEVTMIAPTHPRLPPVYFGQRRMTSILRYGYEYDLCVRFSLCRISLCDRSEKLSSIIAD